MKAIGFYILYATINLLSFLPKCILYGLSDCLYLVLYYVVKYRKTVVFSNLQSSFSEKSEQEIQNIAKKFYKHLADIFIEYIILVRANEKRLSNYVKYTNPEVVSDLMAQGKSVIVVCAHYGNWELSCAVNLAFGRENDCLAVYKRLHNKRLDSWTKKTRSKFGSIAVEMRDIFSTLRKYNRENKLCSVVLIADQLPKTQEMKYSTNFMNHEGTSFFMGPERLAKTFDMAVVYGDQVKTGRGKYEVNFTTLTSEAQKTEKREITELYVKFLENKLRTAPEYWMWSHKRWKRTQANTQVTK